MDIQTQQFLAAVALQLDASVASSLTAIVPEAVELATAEAGHVLAAALAPAGSVADAARSCALVGVLIEQPGDMLLISPDAVPLHPLLAPWVADTLGEMVTRMLLSGVLCTGLAPGAAEFVSLELTQAAGTFWADARLQFTVNGLRVGVLALYGPRPADAAIARVVRVSGQALHRIGASIRPNVPGISDTFVAAPPVPAEAAATIH